MNTAVKPSGTYAVMAQRHEPHDSLDFFPTPPWATRALCEHVLIGGGWRRDQLAAQTVWEPACGEGHMARPLTEYFERVRATDCHPYGYGEVHDFLFAGSGWREDWIVTNPPFRLAAQFIGEARASCGVGVAMLVRSTFLEGVERYRNLFSTSPPAIVAPFAERVPMVKGRLDKTASSATAYSWLVWSKAPHHCGQTRVRWIPPCRAKLERDADYRGEVA